MSSNDHVLVRRTPETSRIYYSATCFFISWWQKWRPLKRGLPHFAALRRYLPHLRRVFFWDRLIRAQVVGLTILQASDTMPGELEERRAFYCPPLRDIFHKAGNVLPL